MGKKPYDRLGKPGKRGDSPMILASADIRIPAKDDHIMQPDQEAPGSGLCTCHSVCTCVPVSACPCDTVCTCDSVCSTNTCTCHPFSDCASHDCTCQPVCSCHSYCNDCTTCTTGGHYWHPN